MTVPPMMKDKAKILIAAEGDTIGEYLFELLNDRDFNASVVDPDFDPGKILSALSSGSYGIAVVTDNNLNRDQLLDVITTVKEKYPRVFCLALVGSGGPDFAMQLERLNIDDFIPMPFEIDYFLARIEAAIQVLARR